VQMHCLTSEEDAFPQATADGQAVAAQVFWCWWTDGPDRE